MPEEKTMDDNDTATTAKRTRLERILHKEGAWLLGICFGIASRFNFDVLVIRVITIIAAVIFPRIMIILYVLLWLFLFRDERYLD